MTGENIYIFDLVKRLTSAQIDSLLLSPLWFSRATWGKRSLPAFDHHCKKTNLAHSAHDFLAIQAAGGKLLPHYFLNVPPP